MRSPARNFLRTLLPFLVVASLAACREQASPIVRMSRPEAAARGLPQSLVPSDLGTPHYVPPRMACAPSLHDQERPGVQLILQRSWIRTDSTRTTSGFILRTVTTVTTRGGEGVYRVIPDTSYGLHAGQALLVNCATQTAEGMMESAG